MNQNNKERCNLCPRSCNVERYQGKKGVCNVSGNKIMVARAALHLWEEPCISGEYGSGTVFFCGCTLGCVYCQNHIISKAETGKEITIKRLAEIFLELQGKNAANINLVTPTHYTPQIIAAVKIAREHGLNIPMVYNCSGYEKAETLKLLENIVDIYLTDFKYMDSTLAKKYSRAPDYPKFAKSALAEMVRQQPRAEFDENGMMKKGVIVRHLLLPNQLQNAKEVVSYVYDTYRDRVFLSLMNQYTPLEHVESIPDLNRAITKKEYDELIDYAISLGVENGFIQEGETASESFIPSFDNEGI